MCCGAKLDFVFCKYCLPCLNYLCLFIMAFVLGIVLLFILALEVPWVTMVYILGGTVMCYLVVVLELVRIERRSKRRDARQLAAEYSGSIKDAKCSVPADATRIFFGYT